LGEFFENDDNNNLNGVPGMTDAATGILLISKQSYFMARGYDERNIYFNHMEIEFIQRLRKFNTLINLDAILNTPFYHVYHERNDSDIRKRNARGVRSDKIFTNNKNWGKIPYYSNMHL